jgi:hypothetical protein
MIKICRAVGYNFDNFWVAMTQETRHLAGRPIKKFMTRGRVNIKPLASADNILSVCRTNITEKFLDLVLKSM